MRREAESCLGAVAVVMALVLRYCCVRPDQSYLHDSATGCNVRRCAKPMSIGTKIRAWSRCTRNASFLPVFPPSCCNCDTPVAPTPLTDTMTPPASMPARAAAPIACSTNRPDGTPASRSSSLARGRTTTPNLPLDQGASNVRRGRFREIQCGASAKVRLARNPFAVLTRVTRARCNSAIRRTIASPRPLPPAGAPTPR